VLDVLRKAIGQKAQTPPAPATPAVPGGPQVPQSQ